ncbi:amidohydrolase family protein [Spiroplasma citri]|nr:amidohydrolase family protein [Spiroplasma citri]
MRGQLQHMIIVFVIFISSLQDLALVASTNIAKQLGIYSTTGSIAVGKLADLVMLDVDLKVLMTLCEGEIAYSQHNLTQK